MMGLLRPSRWGPSAAAVTLALGATGAAQVFDPHLGGFFFLVAIASVGAAAWAAGWIAGVLAALGTAAIAFLGLIQDPTLGVRHDALLTVLELVVAGGAVVGASAWRRARAQVQRRTRQQAAITDLSRRALAPAPGEDLLQESCNLVLRTLGASRVEIVELGAESPVVRARADRWLARLGRGASDAEESARALARRDDATLVRVASVPIAFRSRAIADLEVYGARPREPVTGDLEFLQAVANLIAGSIGRRTSDLESERMRTRDALLADVSSTLASALDVDTRVRELARVVVPRMADWCVVDLVEESGEIRRVAVEHADPTLGALAQEIQAESTPALRPDHPVLTALHSGEPQLVERVGEAELRRLARDEEDVERIRRAGLRSLLCVPLRARGRILGVMSLGATERDPYGAEDLTLAGEVAARAALAVDNARLYEKVLADDRAKDEFLAMLGHELRNPLAPMVHSLEVFRVASPDSEARERARRVLERQVTQLRHLVRDLLDVARITRGSIDLRRQPVELSAAIANAVESSQSIIEAHRHEVVTTLPKQALWLDADPTRLEQILTNLINNSVQHSRPGTRTEVSGEPDGDFVVVRVKDNGAGLSPEALTHLFDLFARGDVMASGPGTGIGLHLVRRLSELHGGSVEARSAGVGHGSEFIVRLPAAQRSEAPVAAAAAPEAAPSPLRVLVVDDHMDSAAALSELLTIWGYGARVATDGREALRVASEFRPEVVLLDLAMPEMNGYQVAREMRRMPELAHATLVALTGHARAPSRTTSGGYDFDHHWMKPLDPSTLRAFLDERARHRHSAYAS